MYNKRKIAFLVPAYNEEVVIAETIKALLKLAPAEDIYVVDDCSRDNTVEIAKQFTNNVLALNPNRGKATAMNMVIAHYDLSHRYDYIMPMDADTIISSEFISNSLPILEEDKEKKIACVIGKVQGRNNNWITSYRIWEYELAQTVHKSAQAIVNVVTVCPGCATIYRAEIFNTVQIPQGTLTEDMDFTFLIHRHKLGRITYTDKAVVVTQDPGTTRDFYKQLNRWYTGFWQCVAKHNMPWGGQLLDIEVAMLASEGLFNGVLVTALIIAMPIVIFFDYKIVLIPIVIDLVAFLIPSMLYVAHKTKNYAIMKYIGHFYFMRVASSLIFFKCFCKVILAIDLKMVWGSAKRYKVA